MKIAFLCPTLDTDYLKCARALQSAGAEVAFFTFIRDQYPQTTADLPVIRLGRVKHGHYLARFPRLLTAAVKTRKLLSEYDCLYAFNWEMALMGIVATRGSRLRPVIVLQMLDIRPAMLGLGLAGRAFRFAERRVLGRVDLLCLTSQAYLDHYYRPIQKFQGRPVFILENKLAADCRAITPAGSAEGPRNGERIKIGYFGLIRCRKSCQLLEKAVEQGKGRVSLYLRGIPLGEVPDLNNFASGSTWIRYGGEYRAPGDLPDMFSQIDLLWIASPYEDETRIKTDWRWKRTNRFYQGCCFQKPMLAWKNTADGDEVEKLGLGLSLDPEAPDRAVEDILNISSEDLGRWRSNLAKLNPEIYTYTDEHQRIYGIIRDILRQR